MPNPRIRLRLKIVTEDGSVLEMESPNQADADMVLAFIDGKYTDGKPPFGAESDRDDA